MFYSIKEPNRVIMDKKTTSTKTVYAKYMRRKISHTLNQSFIAGVGSVISVSGMYFSPRVIAPSRDIVNMRGDWNRIGADLKTSMTKQAEIIAHHEE